MSTETLDEQLTKYLTDVPPVMTTRMVSELPQG